MTRRIIRLCVLSLLCGSLCGSARGLELMGNGAFEQALEPSWALDTGGAATLVVRATTFQPDGDYEALVQKGSGNGHAKAWQTIAVPTTDLTFSVTARMQASATSGDTHPWAVAAILLYYEDQFGNLHGTTCLARPSSYCPWSDTETFHFIPVADEEWHTYSFDLAQELQYFSGLDPQAVTRIRVCLAGVVGADC
jgi:hypothetical protein